jgi:subtilisin family serine protease
MRDNIPSPMVSLSATAPLTTDMSASMDPRLQHHLVRRRLGLVKAAGVSTAVDEVAVIARVTDVAQWEGLSEVRSSAPIGEDAEGTVVVTARIPVTRIEQVRTQPFVKSLKAAQPLRVMLDATLAETEARPDLLPAATQADGGAGVVVGIVDYGCDFVHQNFRTAGGGTRLLCIWDQNGPTTPASPFGYGRKYTRAEINQALESLNPYDALGYGPDPDVPGGPKGTHGTHVMDIAAGNGRGSNLPGVAPQADLIFVDVSHADLPFSGPEVVERSFGDSARLLEALKFIFDEAGNRPCVINVSLGTNGGPHDGSTLVEKGIDALIRQRPNRAVVIAAANAFDDGIHATGQVAATGTFDLRWRIPTSDFTQNELELWYEGEDRFTVELLAPNGSSVLSVGPGQSDGLTSPAGEVVVFIANRLADPNNSDNTIGIFLEAGLPAGEWIVRLRGDQVTNGMFHAWIERDNLNPSQFAPPHDNSHTIGSISCGQETIVVGSYDAHKPSLPLSWFSSAGPTRDGRQKPEISAPGHDVFAAHSRTKTGIVRKSGTSMAAPAVAGVIALVLGEAHQRGITLTGDQVRQIVIAAAHRNPPAGTNWDNRYGNGRLSASAAIRTVIDLASGGGPVTAVATTEATSPPRQPKARRTTKRATASGSRRARR